MLLKLSTHADADQCYMATNYLRCVTSADMSSS